MFDPSTTKKPKGAINLWRGWAVKPKPVDWSLMREHIHKVLAAGNDEHAEYIIKWLAWLFQHPEQRAESALVFRGKKGSGRGTLGRPMRALCGQHGVQIYSPKLLTGDFNNHLRDCVFLFADEAMWAGHKSADGKLKGMITEDSLPIEGKGKDAISVTNRLHIMMASNNDWVVPATADERRYAVFDTAPDRIGDREYFKLLNDEQYTKQYVPALLYDLLHMDLDGWHPRWDIPQTEALHAQVKLGEQSSKRVFRRMLHDGEPIDGDLVLTDFKDACKAEHRSVNIAEADSFAQGIPRRYSINEATGLPRGTTRRGVRLTRRPSATRGAWPAVKEPKRRDGNDGRRPGRRQPDGSKVLRARPLDKGRLPRTPSRSAVTCTALKGRTHDRTRPPPLSLANALAPEGPSTHASMVLTWREGRVLPALTEIAQRTVITR